MVVKQRRLSVTIKKYYIVCFIVSIIVVYVIITILQNNNKLDDSRNSAIIVTNRRKSNRNSEIISSDLFKNSEYRTQLLKRKVARLERKFNKSRSIILNSKPMLKPNYNVHIFYYGWYGNMQYDGKFKHWNHKYIDNWKKEDRGMYPSGNHLPPNDIGSNFYPSLGCYSSSDPNVIDTHMKQIKEAGVGVIVISWAPSNFTDTPTQILPMIFHTAQKYHMKISLHVEPYPDRNPINLRNNLKEFFQQYGNHPALYKIRKPLSQVEVPVVYIYDSYLIPAVAWKELLSTKGNLSIRGTNIDAIYLGLLVEMQHKYHVKKSQFDGFYTYFATNSFTYGSTWKNWRALSKYAVQNGLIFVPSVGPGYIDTRVRSWNAGNTRPRRHGHYYDVAWRSAINNNANYVSITSFNEWHEGTQIEPAKPKSTNGFTYMDYEPEGPNFYLNLTKVWVEEFTKFTG